MVKPYWVTVSADMLLILYSSCQRIVLSFDQSPTPGHCIVHEDTIDVAPSNPGGRHGEDADKHADTATSQHVLLLKQHWHQILAHCTLRSQTSLAEIYLEHFCRISLRNFFNYLIRKTWNRHLNKTKCCLICK